MDPRYYRPPSPGGRRTSRTERSSTGTLGYDSYGQPYTRPGRAPQAAPGGSFEGVIPISTETYVNGVKTTSSRSAAAYDSYTGRPRQASLSERARKPFHAVSSNVPPRTRPPVIHTPADGYKASSARSPPGYDREYYVQPAPSGSRHAQSKRYSIDNAKGARLMDDRDEDATGRESLEQGGLNRWSAREQRSGYHPNATKPRAWDADYGDGYEYTDAQGMYRDTEPVRRPIRRSSVDGRRERPISMMEQDAPRSTRDARPPVTTRGRDRINGGVSRSGSLREPGNSSVSDRYGPYTDACEPPPTRKRSINTPRGRDDVYTSYKDDYDQRVDPMGKTRSYEDRDVASRGFGIRSGSPERMEPRADDLGRRGRTYEDPSLTQDARRRNYPADLLPRSARDPDRAERYLDRDAEYEELRQGKSDTAYSGRLPKDDVRDRDSDLSQNPRNGVQHDRGRRNDSPELPSGAASAGLGGAAAFAVKEAADRRNRERERHDVDLHDSQQRRGESPGSEVPRRRHYVGGDEARDDQERPTQQRSKDFGKLDPDEEYRRRVHQETDRAREDEPLGRPRHPESEREAQDERIERDLLDSRAATRGSGAHGSKSLEPRTRDSELLGDPRRERDRQGAVLDGGPITREPSQISDDKDPRLRIVEPPREKDSTPPPKGILRKPTSKFPEDPNPVREGVAPLKVATKKGVPPNARWTKIDRRMVNPEALEEAKERFEERMDCVIVLRVLSREEIQKLADRTRELREDRADAEAAKEQRRNRRAEREPAEREREHRRDRDRDRDGRRKEHRKYDGAEEDGSGEIEDEVDVEKPRMIEDVPARVEVGRARAPVEQADFVRQGSVGHGQGAERSG